MKIMDVFFKKEIKDKIYEYEGTVVLSDEGVFRGIVREIKEKEPIQLTGRGKQRFYTEEKYRHLRKKIDGEQQVTPDKRTKRKNIKSSIDDRYEVAVDEKFRISEIHKTPHQLRLYSREHLIFGKTSENIENNRNESIIEFILTNEEVESKPFGAKVKKDNLKMQTAYQGDNNGTIVEFTMSDAEKYRDMDPDILVKTIIYIYEQERKYQEQISGTNNMEIYIIAIKPAKKDKKKNSPQETLKEKKLTFSENKGKILW